MCFGLKTTISAYLFILVRAVLPRYRYDKLLELGWKTFLPLTMGFVSLLLGVLVLFDALPYSPELSVSADLIAQKFL